MELIRGKQDTAKLVVLYGTSGVGKSTLSSTIENSVFIDIEGGLDEIDCVKTPRVKTYNQFKSYIRDLAKESFNTIIIDSADSLENLMTKEILAEHDKKSLADFGYGKGYELLSDMWTNAIDAFSFVKDKGINVVIIGHDQIQRYEDPRHDGYDKIMLKLHKKSAANLIARCDALLFMTYDMIVKTSENVMEKNKAVGKGKRIVLCSDNPAYQAKNRFNLPDKITNIGELFNFLKKNNEQKKEEQNV